jgi:hypothetical protein
LSVRLEGPRFADGTYHSIDIARLRGRHGGYSVVRCQARAQFAIRADAQSITVGAVGVRRAGNETHEAIAAVSGADVFRGSPMGLALSGLVA